MVNGLNPGVSVVCLVIVRVRVVFRKTVGKWFEPRSISCLSSVIVRVRVVFRKTVGKWFEPRGISCLSNVIVRVRVVFRKTELLVTDVSTTDQSLRL